MPKTFSLLCVCVLLSVPALTVVAAGAADEDASAAEPAADMSMGAYNEAPMLAAMVADGELPPVDERSRSNPPWATSPRDEIGTYGGRSAMFHTSSTRGPTSATRPKSAAT